MMGSRKAKSSSEVCFITDIHAREACEHFSKDTASLNANARWRWIIAVWARLYVTIKPCFSSGKTASSWAIGIKVERKSVIVCSRDWISSLSLEVFVPANPWVSRSHEGKWYLQFAERWSACAKSAEAFTRSAAIEKPVGETDPERNARMIGNGAVVSTWPYIFNYCKPDLKR